MKSDAKIIKQTEFAPVRPIMKTFELPGAPNDLDI